MAKRRNVSGRVLRNAVPQPRDVAEFVAPRTVNEGLSIANIFGDAAEMTPFAGAVPYAERELGLRDYSDEDILLSAIMGFPILGKFKNLKEALGPRGWGSFKYNIKNSKRKLYSDPEKIGIRTGNPDEISSSRARINATQDIVSQPTISTVIGPTRGNTNLGIRSEGRQMVNTNTITRSGPISRAMDGRYGYQGDEIYSPLRMPVDNNIHGPWRTDLSKADKPLQDLIAKNEDKWQYYVDDALSLRSTPERAEDLAQGAIEMGRPDIADKIRNGQKSNRTPGKYKPYNSFSTTKNRNFNGDTKKYMDHSNRQIEKSIREQFAITPDELKQEFSQRYGTWDLLNDWKEDPQKWADYKQTVKRNRVHRNASNRWGDIQYGRDIER